MDKSTNITTLVFLVWNILLYHVCTSSNVYYMQHGISWSEASTKCGGKGLEDNEDKLKDSDIQIGIEFWIGKAVFRELTPWIEVLGCILANSMNNDIKTYKVASIGQCQTKCDAGKVFGYKYKETQTNCICFTKGSPTDLNSACHMSSDFLVHTSYNGTITDDPVDPGNCVTLFCDDKRLKLVGQNCGSTSYSIVGRCQPFGGTYEKWTLNYYRSRNYCWHNNRLLLPSSICGSNSSFSKGVRAWSNIFRETFDIVKSGSNKNPTFCYTGVLHQTGNEQKQINITRKHCTGDIKVYICKDEKTVQHQSTANIFHEISFNQVSTIQPKLSSTAKIVQHKTTAITLHSTSFNHNLSVEKRSTSIVNISGSNPITTSQKALTNNPLTDDSPNKNSDTKSYTAMIIGGATGTVVFLLISAAIFVCRKRSIGIFKGKEKTHDDKVELPQRPNYDSQCANGSHVKPISNHNYGIAINQSTTYAVVDKLKKSDKKFTKNDATYSDLPDGQYDQLNNIQTRKIILEGNLYDSHEGMRDQNDPTYDSSKLNSHGSSHEVTDVYDHSFLGTQNDGEYAYSSTYRLASTNDTEIYDKTV